MNLFCKKEIHASLMRINITVLIVAMLLALSAVLQHPAPAYADGLTMDIGADIAAMQLKLKRLEREIEDVAKQGTVILKSGDNSAIAELNDAITDLNNRADELRREIKNDGTYRTLEQDAENLWSSVQNLRGDMREGSIDASAYKADWGPEYNKIKKLLDKAGYMRNEVMGGGEPCSCELRKSLEWLELVSNSKSDINGHIREMEKRADTQWRETVEDVGNKSDKLKKNQMGLPLVNGADVTNILWNAAFDAADKVFEVGLGGISELGAGANVAGRTISKLGAKGAGKVNALNGAIKRLSGKETAQQMRKTFPKLAELDDTCAELMAWVELSRAATRVENELWDRFTSGTDCLKSVKYADSPCRVSGLADKKLGGGDSEDRAMYGTRRLVSLENKIDTMKYNEGDCGDFCLGVALLYELKDLRAAAEENRWETSKGMRATMNDVFKQHIRLIDYLSREEDIELGTYLITGSTYEFLAVALSFGSGTGVAVGETFAKSYGRSWVKNIKSDTAKIYLENMRENMGGLEELDKALYSWDKLYKDVDSTIALIWKKLPRDCKKDCGEKEDKKAAEKKEPEQSVQASDEEPADGQEVEPGYEYEEVWGSNWGDLVLYRGADGIRGTYDFESGKIAGTLKGHRLEGIWGESPSFEPPWDKGMFYFEFNEDWTSFTGRWKYWNSRKWDSGWNGWRKSSKRVVAPEEEPEVVKAEWTRCRLEVERGGSLPVISLIRVAYYESNKMAAVLASRIPIPVYRKQDTGELDWSLDPEDEEVILESQVSGDGNIAGLRGEAERIAGAGYFPQDEAVSEIEKVLGSWE